MKISAKIRSRLHRREKLPPLERPDVRPPSWASNPRSDTPLQYDMYNRRSADAFGMGGFGDAGFGDGGFIDGGGGGDT